MNIVYEECAENSVLTSFWRKAELVILQPMVMERAVNTSWSGTLACQLPKRVL